MMMNGEVQVDPSNSIWVVFLVFLDEQEDWFETSLPEFIQ